MPQEYYYHAETILKHRCLLYNLFSKTGYWGFFRNILCCCFVKCFIYETKKKSLKWIKIIFILQHNGNCSLGLKDKEQLVQALRSYSTCTSLCIEENNVKSLMETNHKSCFSHFVFINGKNVAMQLAIQFFSVLLYCNRLAER